MMVVFILGPFGRFQISEEEKTWLMVVLCYACKLYMVICKSYAIILSWFNIVLAVCELIHLFLMLFLLTGNVVN